MEIKKKTWPELFEKILKGEKNMELRLADFGLSKGDILVLEEYNPKTKRYTGRAIRKRIKNINKFNPTDAWSVEDIKRFRCYEIEM